MQPLPATPPRAPLPTVALYLLGVAGIAFGITLLFLGMRAVMDIGGFCAEGGPYVIETTCPQGTAAATLLGVFAGMAGFFVALGAGSRIGARAVGALLLAWPALFGTLGFNFLQYGFDPPGDDPGWAWAWLVCGVVFWVMAFGPLLAGLWIGSSASELGGRHGAAEARLMRAAPGGTRLVSRSLGRAAAPAADDLEGTFPLPVSTGAAAGPREPDIVDGLERLAALHRTGALTDEEYARAKVELLERAGA